MHTYNFNIIVREMGGQEHHLKGRERARMSVRIRDGFTCQSCGDFRPIRVVTAHNTNRLANQPHMKLFDVHHLDGECGKNSRGFDSISDITKLITLCHSCHYKHHQHSMKLNPVKKHLQTIHSARNHEIVGMRRSGKKLIEIGTHFGISRERVRQILARFAEEERLTLLSISN